MRTTVNIDDSVLREVKKLRQKEGRSMGAIMSELLVDALARRRSAVGAREFRWASRPMRARLDPADKDALHAVLDRDEP